MIEQLTEKQKLFCILYTNGLTSNDAAKKAGYKVTKNANHGSIALRSQTVKNEVVRLSNDRLSAVGPMVLNTLIDLMENGKKEEIRLSAARDLADRIGLGIEKNSQQNLQVNINLGEDNNTLVNIHPPPFPGRKIAPR